MVVEETKVIAIDSIHSRAVEDLPEDIKSLVKFYDNWRQQEIEAHSDLLQVQTAIRALANQIGLAIKSLEEEEAREEGEKSNDEKL